jgi:hypothetical protein
VAAVAVATQPNVAVCWRRGWLTAISERNEVKYGDEDRYQIHREPGGEVILRDRPWLVEHLPIVIDAITPRLRDHQEELCAE